MSSATLAWSSTGALAAGAALAAGLAPIAWALLSPALKPKTATIPMAATVAPTRARLRKAFEARRPLEPAARGADRLHCRQGGGALGGRPHDLAVRGQVHLGEEGVDLVVADDPAPVLVVARRREEPELPPRWGEPRRQPARGIPVGRRCRRPTGKDGRPCACADEGDGACERGRVRKSAYASSAPEAWARAQERRSRGAAARYAETAWWAALTSSGVADESRPRRARSSRSIFSGVIALPLAAGPLIALPPPGTPTGRALVLRAFQLPSLRTGVHARSMTPATKCRPHAPAIPSSGRHKCARVHAFAR